MKKVAEFIVEKRYFVLILFIVLTCISIFLSTKVTINDDISKYLPKNSETRIGMEIMDREFDKEKKSDLYVMFENIAGQEEKILDELATIDGIQEVEYEFTNDYNRDGYTLYRIDVSDYSDSKTAAKVYDSINEKFSDYKINLSGSIYDENKPVLPSWIIFTAIGSAIVILIIMCDSYIEPFLFLFTIGLAVYLNKGTNIIFPSVSNVTDSICAILQMALSMDYSIMLMNRYTQEKGQNIEKKEAMKKALHNSFSSISSSSVTTIVGLMALVFMSFTIGKDLGFVLAKGVLLSLVCIFAVLPGLILMFDNLIEMTKKKHLDIKTNKIAITSYNLRYVGLALIIIMFGVSYVLKGNLKILYTESQNDVVHTVFPNDNQMAIVYNSKDEEEVAKICRNVNSAHVSKVMCYGNTIGEKLTYQGLTKRIDELGTEKEIDDYLLRMVYYNYYASNNTVELSTRDFITFIENEVYTKESLAKHVSVDTKTDIAKLKYFAIPEEFRKQRTSAELAEILGIEKSSIDNLLLYYHSYNTDTQLTINEFIEYVYRDVLNNDIFKPYINDDILRKLNKLNSFINVNTLNTKYSSKEMASLFGVDETIMDNLYLYYNVTNGVDYKMSMYDFSSFLLNDIVTNPTYASQFDENAIDKIRLLNKYSNTQEASKVMGAEELSGWVDTDESKIKLLLILLNLDKDNNSTYTLKNISDQSIEVLNNLLNQIKENPDFIKDLNYDDINTIVDYIKNYDVNENISIEELEEKIPNIISELNLEEYKDISIKELYEKLKVALKNKIENLYEKSEAIKKAYDDGDNLTYHDLSSLIGIDEKYTKILYVLLDSKNSKLASTPKELISYIIDNKDNPLLATNLDDEKIESLTKVKSIIDNSYTNYNYSEMANIIGMDEEITKKLYGLYVSRYTEQLFTKKEIIDFVLEYKNSKELSKIDSETISQLETLRNVITSVENDTYYNATGMSALLGVDTTDMRLLYSNYDLINNYNQTISIKELTDFILTEVVSNPRFNGNISNETRNKLSTLNLIMNDSSANKKYTSINMYETLSPLSEQKFDYNLLDLLYLYYGSVNSYSNVYKLTLEEFVNYLNDDILKEDKFSEFIEDDMKQEILESKKTITEAKKMLVGKNYSRAVIYTDYGYEDDNTFEFIKDLKSDLSKTKNDNYLIGNSPMAYDLNSTFGKEFNFISLLTMILIFTVVAVTFKSVFIPFILTLIIQCSVYITMFILSIFGGNVYFISLLIVQSILMGATIDYAILYTSYYIEYRGTYNKKGALINAYKQSIHTILTSASVLIIVTFIVGFFANAISSKICMTISQGTLCATLLVLFILPSVLASLDKALVHKK